jgi:hypothetical protein
MLLPTSIERVFMGHYNLKSFDEILNAASFIFLETRSLTFIEVCLQCMLRVHPNRHAQDFSMQRFAVVGCNA